MLKLKGFQKNVQKRLRYMQKINERRLKLNKPIREGIRNRLVKILRVK